MTQEKKVQTAVVMDVTPAEESAKRLINTVGGMATSIAKDGERASKGLEGMAAGAESADRAVDAATKRISDKLRRVTRETQRELAAIAATSSGGAGSPAAIEYEAVMAGASMAKLQPQIDALRVYKDALGQVTAVEREFAEAASVSKKAADAARLVQASEYVNWWASSLEKADAAERELAETAAFDKKAAQAASLVRASEYADWWSAALGKAELAEKEFAETAAFDRKAAEAAKLGAAIRYVDWWSAALAERDKEEAKAAESKAFVRGIELKTEALQRQIKALQLSQSEFMQWEAAQAGFGKESAAAISAFKAEAAALDEAANAVKRKAEADKFAQGVLAQANALGKTRAQLLEEEAVRLGKADELSGAIAKIREADGAMGGMGANAKQLQWALRGLPAQFTDIWVSLASGQNPMMVFIQQGGQIKDMFAGTGADGLKQVARYALGLVNPFTVAAAAAGVLALAWKSGSDEITKLNQAVILSGEKLGVTADQLQGIAASVAGLGKGTQGAASEFLGLIAKDAKVAAGDLQRFTEAALSMERAGGPAAAETAKAFAELGKEPLQASLRLTGQFNYLTQATYQQIRALEESGRTTEAAALAQRAYAEFLEQRSPRMEAALGLIERAWRGVKNATAEAWDRLKTIGRDDTLQQQYAALSASIIDIEAGKLGERAKGDLPALREQANELRKQVELQQSSAIAAEQRRKVLEAEGRLTAFDNENASKKEKERREIAAFERDALAAGRERKYIEDGIATIRAKYADKSSSAAAPRVRMDQTAITDMREYANSMDALRKIQLDSVAGAEQLSKSQAKLRDIMSSPAWGDYSRQQQEQIIYQAGVAQTAEDAAREQKEWAASVAESEREYSKLITAMENSAEGAERQLASLEIENRARALAIASGIDLKEAIDQVTIARLEERRVVLAAAGNDAAVEAIDREIEARKKLAVELRRASVYDAEKKRAEELIKEYEKLSDTITDALMRGFENGKDFARNFRDTVVNMFKTMVLRPVIQAIVNPVAMSLTGGLGGASGASAATNIVGQAGGGVAQSLQNMYTALTSSFESIGTSAAMTADKIGSWLVSNTTGTLKKAGGTLMQYAGDIGAFSEVAAGTGAGMGLRRAIGRGYEISGGMSTLQDIGVAVASAIGGPVLGSIVGAVSGLVNRAFGRGPKTAYEQGIEGMFGAGDATGDAYSDWIKKGGWFRSDKRGTDRTPWDKDVSDALDAGAMAVLEQTKTWATALKLPADRLGEITSSFRVKFTDDAEANKAAIAEAINNYGVSLASAYGDILKPLQKAGESLGQTLGRISTLQTFSENLNQLGSVFSRVANLGIDVRESFIEMAGGMEALWQNAMGFAQNYYTREEIAGLKAGEIQQALLDAGLSGASDLTGRADFRALVESVDVNTEAGRQQLATLLSVQAAFVDVADYLTETGSTLAQAATMAPESGALTSLISPMQQNTDATNSLSGGMDLLRDSINRMIDVIKSGQLKAAVAPEPAPIASPEVDGSYYQIGMGA